MQQLIRFLFAGFALFSSSVYAVDYYWVTGRTANTEFSDRSTACSAAADDFTAKTSYTVTLERMSATSATSGVCHFLRDGTPNLLQTTYSRRGDSCPDDMAEDAVTGECIPPPHVCETGDVIGPYKYSGYLVGGFVITDPDPPLYACKNGCEYSKKAKASVCQTGHFGTFCSYEYVGTGVECTSSPENDMGGDSGEGPNANEGGDGGDNNDSDPQDDVPEAPPSSDAKGDAKESTLQEVKSVLGTLSKESTSKKIESGINKGNSLLGEIKDALNNLPNGGGGSGDGDGDEDAEPSAEVGSCSDALVCSGDAIQCAMLQVQKNQLCAYQITPEVEQQIQSIFEGEENQLETKEIAIASVFTDGLNAARWLPSSCPVPESVTVFGRSYSISWEPLCTFASALSALIVAIASIFFIVYLGKGLKGS